jgi:amino-acid N-acetyltransferase
VTPLALPVVDAASQQATSAWWRGRPALTLVRDAPATPVLRRAEPADAAAVHALLEIFVARGLLLPRSVQQVQRTIRDYIVAIEGGRVVGSVALRYFSEQLAEVSALAVAEQLQGSGIGRRLVESVIIEARGLGLRRLFALTLQEGFFRRLGFTVASIGDFPQKVATDCSRCPRRTGCREITVTLTL